LFSTYYFHAGSYRQEDTRIADEDELEEFTIRLIGERQAEDNLGPQ
jgi:hypothetical protein